MTPVYIGLGSNLGDRLARIQEAVWVLGERLVPRAASPLYETAPMYVEDQPPFYNGVLAAETDLGPLQVLRILKDVENRVGRMPRERYGPREIDLDLLVYGCVRYAYADSAPESGCVGSTSLALPHPRTPERRFVLRPLCDVAPDLVLPGQGAVEALLAQTKNQATDVLLVSHAVLSLHRRG